MSFTVKIIISLIVCLSIGGLSGFLTTDAILNYYQTLNKPSWNPPNWLFGPVWTVLYLMMSIAIAIVWHQSGNKTAMLLFGTQLVLNFFWSLIFFRWQSPGLALIEILAMLTFIVLTVLAFKKINTTAFYLMIPYLCWVSFATFLNFTIWRLN
jgi:translocator protein